MKGLPLTVILLLFATPALIASGQILFKITSLRVPATGSLKLSLVAILLDPVFLCALFLYGFATLLWIYVLKAVPLAQAYSFMALTFVLVPLLAFSFLGETLTLKYLAGVLLIVGGLVVIHT